ncbi:RNA polymerase-binding protein DksA [Sulfurospirillum arcachonense]|uniref:RNA polymerase-binding protein DksA n=1 Tax=Sulfurospirillum arcachonense TaxID=57666 RepID=UPI00046935C6|nr:RNA polymerase-binding protein DksA [Sulfurospirillum arcachonense]
MRDSDLKYFEDLLVERKTQIKKNIDDAAKEIESLKDDDVGDEADHASISTDRMIEQAISAQQRRELGEIDFSLSKIKSGGYGICEMCEEDISFQRLKVKPYAKYCIVCREIIEKQNK